MAAVPARDYVQGDLQIRLTKTMAWATTAVALILGSIGLLNTMVMAVFERTGEVGLLRALGWRRRRVLTLILGEAMVLGLLGALVGTALAYLGVRALLLDRDLSGLHRPELAACRRRDRPGDGPGPELARRPLPGAPGRLARPDRGPPP